MRDIPRNWKIHNFKLKSTRMILELYLSLLKEKKPNCTTSAIISLWDRPEFKEWGWEHAFISAQIHNLRHRIWCAYYAGTSHHIVNIAQEVGMLPFDRYVKLVEFAINLPKEYCGDFYKET